MKGPCPAAVWIGVVACTASAAWATPVTLSQVPEYNWYHGCGPTAAACVVGYYDVLGYSNLFDAAGWDAVKVTGNVKTHISSPEHNAKYDPTPDNASLPVPDNTSLACWFRTSVGSLNYGWSYQSYADDTFEGYMSYRGYVVDARYEYWSSFSWEKLVAEIDAGRPMMFLVDSSGSGGTDHFVPIIGYDDRGDGNLYYACYDVWREAETVRWQRFRAMSSSYSWGVGYATYIEISAHDGDANRDAITDLQDFSLLKAHYGETGAGWTDGDFNGDGLVDMQDFSIFKSNCGVEWAGLAQAPVPEPATLALLALAGAGAWPRRRQR